MSKQKIIVANWKANPLTSDEAKKTAKGIVKYAKKYSKVETVICPTSLHMEAIAKLQRKPVVKLGSQDTFAGTVGSHTGEVTIDMLSKIGVSYVIVGHSERRAMGETEQDVAAKLQTVIQNKSKAILCIGELERDKEARYLTFVHDQLIHSLGDIEKKDLKKIIIAYEPVWAIGAKDSDAMKGSDMYEMVIFIQRIIHDAFGEDVAKKVKILYGGSVSSVNAGDILENGHVDGLLIGRQSLYPESFGQILEIASKTK